MCLSNCEGGGMESQQAPSSADGHAHAEFKGTRHWRSMALDTLRPDEAYRIFEKGRKSILQPCSLTTEGIELAQPAPVYRFLNRGLYKVSSLSKTWDDLDRPRPWIPAHVNRTFNNLTVDDIKGARPNPKNMKLGNAARGTNPLEPVYKLPTCKDSPPLEPKFLRDNLNVDDISGARSRQRVRFSIDSAASGEVVEGSFPGWRPAHRRRFGKTVRDLCLQVQDINKTTRRMVRNPSSEAYLEIEGMHPKHLKQFQICEVRNNHSLQAHDIEGTEAGSGTWMFNVLRRKEEGKERTYTLKHQVYSESLARGILNEKVQGCGKELVDFFKQLDRDKSGKLTTEEVRTALNKMQVDLNPAELKSLSSAFDTDLDGFVDYQKLLQVEHKKHHNATKLDSRIISLCLNQWVDRPWPAGTCVKSQSSIRAGTGHRLMKDPKSIHSDSSNKSQSTEMENGKFVEELNIRCGRNSHIKPESQPTVEIKQADKILSLDSGHPNDMSLGVEFPVKSCKFPLPLGLPFWPDGKALQDQQTPRAYLSLPQDYKETTKNPSRPLSDDEKAWEKKVGGTLFTGEGNVVSHGSYMHGYDWSRPSSTSARMPYKKRRVVRSQSLPGFCYVPELDMGISTARSENFMTTSKATNSLKSLKRPVSASITQNVRRPMSASCMQTSKVGQFCSPRSVLMSPMSSRSSWSPRSGIFSFESTPRTRELCGGSISARESVASRNQAERMSQKLQTARREDAAAVRSLF